jgi:hypothetical protein
MAVPSRLSRNSESLSSPVRATCPSHSMILDYITIYNNIWRVLQITKLLTKRISPASLVDHNIPLSNLGTRDIAGEGAK